jgi:hypothetical protein
MGELQIFIHNLETRFLSRVLAIIGSTLLIMVNWKKKTTHQAFENLLYEGIIWRVGQWICISWED